MNQRKSASSLSLNINLETTKNNLSFYAKEIKGKILKNKQLVNQILPLNIQIGLQKKKLSKLTKINSVSQLKSEIITHLTSNNFYLIDTNKNLMEEKNKLNIKKEKLIEKLNASIESLNNQLTALKDYNFIYINKIKYKDTMIQKYRKKNVDSEMYLLNGGSYESKDIEEREIDFNDENFRRINQEYFSYFNANEKKFVKKLRNFNKMKQKCNNLTLKIKQLKDYLNNLDNKNENLDQNELNYEDSENSNNTSNSISENNEDETEKMEINLDSPHNNNNNNININSNNNNINKKIYIPKLDFSLINYNFYRSKKEKDGKNSREFEKDNVTKKIKEMKKKIKNIKLKNTILDGKCQKFEKKIQDLEKIILENERKKIHNYSLAKYSRYYNFSYKNGNKFENKNKKSRFNNSTPFGRKCNNILQSSF